MYNKAVELNAKRIANLVKIAIDDYGLEAAPNKVRRELATIKRTPAMLEGIPYSLEEVEAYMTATATKLDEMLSELYAKRQKR